MIVVGIHVVGTGRYGIGTGGPACVIGCRYACFSRFKVVSVCVCGCRYARGFKVGTGRYAVGTWRPAGLTASHQLAR